MSVVGRGVQAGTAESTNSSHMPVMAVRDDTLTTLGVADGTFTHLRVDSTGALHTTSSGGGGGSSTGAAAEGEAASGNPVLVGGRYDVSARTLDDGDVGAIALNSKGQVILAEDGAAIAVKDGDGSLTVDNAALSVTGGGTEASALRVTIANDSTGSLAITTGTSATDIAKAEDATHSTGDVGVMSLAVRNDTQTSLSDTTGDYSPVQVDSLGSMRVSQEIYKPFETTTNLVVDSLNGAIGGGTGVVLLTDASGFNGGTGYARIEDEVVAYTYVNNTTLNLTSRGVFGTVATGHDSAVAVRELYDSGIQRLDTWSQVITKIACDVGTNGIFIWYSDSGGTNEVRRLTPTVTASYDYLSAPAFAPYVRYTIAPTDTTSTSMYFTTEFSRQSLHPQLFTLDSGVFSSMVSLLTRSVLVGQQLGTTNFANVNITSSNELLTNTLASNRSMVVHTRQNVGTDTTWYMLVDLSDTSGWPHSETTGVVIDCIKVSVIAGASSTGTLDVGVVTRVDGTDGDVTFVIHDDWVGESGGGAGQSVFENSTNFSSSGLNATVTGGNLDRMLSSQKVSNDSAINTLTSLTGVGSAEPGVGDLVFRIENSNESGVDVAVTLNYHSV